MQTKKPDSVRISIAILSMALAAVSGLRAQSSTPPPAAASTTTSAANVSVSSSNTASGAEEQKVTTLEKFTVSDVPVEDQILPTVRPISSVYGDDRDIIDIPRSV